MAGSDGENGRSSGTLGWAIRTAGIAGFVGLAATHYLAGDRERTGGPVRMAQTLPGRPADPETTGSLAAGARSVRIDPCGAGIGVSRPRP